MHLRTVAFACACALAVWLAPDERTEAYVASAATPAHAPVTLRGCEQPALPFLGSGGTAVQVPVVQPTNVLPLCDRGAAGQQPPHLGAGSGQRHLASPAEPGVRHANVRACLLGTPPPPRSHGRCIPAARSKA